MTKHFITQPREPKGIPIGGRWTRNPAHAALDKNGQIQKKCYKSRKYGDTTVYLTHLQKILNGELSCADISNMINDSIALADTTRANARAVWDAPSPNPDLSPAQWAAVGATVVLGAATIYAASVTLATLGAAASAAVSAFGPLAGMFAAGSVITGGGTLIDDISRAFGISIAESIPDIPEEDTAAAREFMAPFFKEAIEKAQRGEDISDILAQQLQTIADTQIGSIDSVTLASMYQASLARYLDHMAYYHASTLPKSLLAVSSDCQRLSQDRQGLENKLERLKSDFEKDCWTLP